MGRYSAVFFPVRHAVCTHTPVLWVGVFEQLSQLQRVLADLLNWGEQEAIQRDVDHLLKQSAGLKKEHVFVDLHELGQLDTGVWMVVAIL